MPQPQIFPQGNMEDLRTPSALYNHGGYYGPADPRACSMPNGPCGTCQDRLACMEPCPACGIEGTYKHHRDHGHSVCHGCDAKICSECAHGARYTCAVFQTKLREPSIPLERQLTEDKWDDAERYMNEHPERRVFEVASFGIHVYMLVRFPSGRLMRVHVKDEM